MSDHDIDKIPQEINVNGNLPSKVENKSDDKVDDQFYPPLLLKECVLPKPCRRMAFALFIMCLAIIGQGMVVTGQLPISLTMLEKNFGYTSVQTGTIHSCYDVFFGVGAMTVGHYAKKRKIFVVGIGLVVMSLGCFLFTLPNFIHNYKTFDSNNESMTMINNYSLEYSMCRPQDGHDKKHINIINKSTGSNIGYLVIFCLSYTLIGWSASPMHTTALAYFDENLTPEKSGFYLGIYYLFGAIGPAIGFGLGSPFLLLPVTLRYDTNSRITPESESWIGAWWLGYIVCGLTLATTAILFVLYPSRKPRLPSNNNNVNVINKKNSADSTPLKQSSKNNFKTKVVNYVNSFKILLTNIPYITLITGMSIKGICVNGLGTFLAKFFEVQFRVSSSKACILSGILIVIGAGLGCILGGVIMKKKGRTVQNNILFIFVITFISALLYSTFLFGCKSRNLGKIELDKNLKITDHTTKCQKNCNCKLNKYEPVCEESTQITHISACLAGCRVNYTMHGKLHFKQCDCLDSPKSVVVQGGCVAPCNYLILFMIVSLLALFLTFLVFVPELSLMLQLLPTNSSKNPGLVLQQIFSRIGFIIGPLIYGILLDKSCILWSTDDRNSDISYCLEYDNYSMRIKMTTLSMGLLLFSSFFYLISYVTIRKDHKNKLLTTKEKVDAVDNLTINSPT